MAERPLILLPQRVEAAKAKRGGGGGSPQSPGVRRQQERLGSRLDDLEAAFEAKRVQLQTSASGLDPEDVLVLETAGTIEDFYKAVARIEGLELLGEYDEEDIPPDDDFFLVDKKGIRKEYNGRLYLVFTSQEAFKRVLRLWDSWQKGRKLERGLTKWRDVFSLLRDIRPWGIRDRIEETGVLDDWRERIELGEETLPCEIELWYRTDPRRRREAAARVRNEVAVLAGDVVSECAIDGIHYHAIAARLPIMAVQRLLDQGARSDVSLVQCEQIQFFRASGQMAGRVPLDSREALSIALDLPYPAADVEPVIALLDGLPLQSHRTLDGRLTIDDPEDFGSNYQAGMRVHGTAMASLIIWGDLNVASPVPIPQPLYVRPILRPVDPPESLAEAFEQVPDRVLVVDLVHRAVRRIFETDSDQPPAAPSVSVINLSIGIRDRLFDNLMSPLAKLLDWLSWEYPVLFLVSAGNHVHEIDSGVPWSELAKADPDELKSRIIEAIAIDSRHRRLLSPAEGMNVLTIGATHDDEDLTSISAMHIDPVPRSYPSVINAQGLGYKRSIKPEVLLPGGRVQLRKPVQDRETKLSLVRAASSPGQRVASPGSVEGDLSSSTKSMGTSNATALTSRAAAFLVPVLGELRSQEGGELVDDVPTAVWLKVLIVHGAQWGEPGERFRELLKTEANSKKFSEYVTRFLGYGATDPVAVSECTESRVTALAGGKIAVDAGFEHRFPLPPSLSGRRGWRRLTVTLAWMSPINPRSHRWRRAHLWFSAPQSKMRAGSQRTSANWRATQRGTVQHDVFEGDKATGFVDGDEIVILVSCRKDAGALEVEVPYALAVTLEVAEELGIDIYTEVRERVRSRLRIPAGGPAT